MQGYSFQHQSSSPWKKFTAFIRRRDALSILIFINIAVWVIISLIRVVFTLSGESSFAFLNGILSFLGAPASLPALATSFWTLITYSFVHIDFLHLLFNMLWLYWIGKIFMEYLSQRQLIWIYILGGVSGYLVYMFSFNLFPGLLHIAPNSRLIGASAAVMAIVTAIAFYLPKFRINLLFFGRIRLIHLAIALFVLDFLMISSNNPGGHLSHIGGCIFGYLYIVSLRKGWFLKLNPKRLFKPKPKFNIKYRPGSEKAEEEYFEDKKRMEEEIDRILDKIKITGYNGLTAKEKETLFKYSKK